MTYPRKIDLHMHTVVSDGTDTPEEILSRVRDAGIELFSVTDHDAIKAAGIIPGLLSDGDPLFLPGVELSCRDKEGKYHILGYGYDPTAEPINTIVTDGHRKRLEKVKYRLNALRKEYGFTFPDKELETLFSLYNPGKPHIGNLMVKLGYVKSRDEAIRDYLNKIRTPSVYLRPEEAIEAILASGGLPVLAHPTYGSGEELILGEEMDERLKKLTGFGLRGIEVFYSGFTEKIRAQLLGFAEQYDLYITAGSDYHGDNKLIELGDTGITAETPIPDGLRRFLDETVKPRLG